MLATASASPAHVTLLTDLCPPTVLPTSLGPMAVAKAGPGRDRDFAATDRVWRSSGRLADGREIIYFDESPGLGRPDFRDGRNLASLAMPPKEPVVGQDGGLDGGLRWDPLLGEWVMFATGRRDRPILPPAELCPLCASRPSRQTEIPAPGYDVVVFENRFPVLRDVADSAVPFPDLQPVADSRLRAGPLPLVQRHGHRRCELICFTGEHNASFASLSPRRVRTVLALHLQVLPVGRGPGEVKFLAGTESAAGVWSNDVLP
jgi:hypothetical protein